VVRGAAWEPRFSQILVRDAKRVARIFVPSYSQHAWRVGRLSWPLWFKHICVYAFIVARAAGLVLMFYYSLSYYGSIAPYSELGIAMLALYLIFVALYLPVIIVIARAAGCALLWIVTAPYRAVCHALAKSVYKIEYSYETEGNGY
jgi:hypothetical protein